MNTQYAGRFKINSVTLLTNSGYKMDLSKITVKIKIEESILKDSISGEITFVETTDFTNAASMIGQERLFISLGTPLNQNRIDKEALIDFNNQPLYVYKMMNIGVGVNKSVNGVKLFFVSDNAFKNLRTRVSKSYKGNCSSVVERILKEQLKTKSDIEVEESSNNIHMVSPNIRPYQMIDIISRRSLNKDSNCSHLFYETTKGLRFNSIDSMFERDVDFAYSEGEPDPIFFNDYIDQIKIFEEIETLNIIDHRNVMDSFKEGYFSSTLLLHNIYDKKVEERKIKFADTNATSMPYSLSKDEEENDLTQYDNSLVYSQLFNSGKSVGAEGDLHLNNFLNRRNKMLHLQRSFMIGMTVKGFSYLEPGMKLLISTRKKSDVVKDNTNDFYDGEYILSSITHEFMFDKMSYTMNLGCYKIGLNKDLPSININDFS